MGKYRTNEQLMSAWKEKHLEKGYINFIEDGILDQEKWDNSDLKICFFLKEAYGDYGSLFNLFNSWDKIKYVLWHNVSYWTYALNKCFENDKIPDFDICKESETEREKYFSQIAVVNIKKSNGKSETKKDDLDLYVKDDKLLIKNQLEIIKPNIVVCGGTYEEYCEINDLIPYKDKVTDWTYFEDNTLIFDFIHPAAQVHGAMPYYMLSSIFLKSKDKVSIFKHQND